MSEIKTLAQKMDIGRYGKLGTLGSQNFRRLRRAKSGFHYRGGFRYTYSERHPTPVAESPGVSGKKHCRR